MATETSETYAWIVATIERQVASLNEALGLSTEFDEDCRRTCVTFGYIGNCEPAWGDQTGEFRFDDRRWMVFLPHPGRVGTPADQIGSFRTGDEVGARAALTMLSGAVALARWQKSTPIPAPRSDPQPCGPARPARLPKARTHPDRQREPTDAHHP